CFIETTIKGGHRLMFNIGKQKTDRTEESSDRRDHNSFDVESLCEIRSVHWSITADCKQSEPTWIGSSLGRHRLERPHPIGISYQVNAVSRVGRRKEDLFTEGCHRQFGLLVVNRQIATTQPARVEIAKK